MKIEHLLYGGDYNPEQWLDKPEILKKDIEYMKEAKINVVSMGMFSWSMLEPEEGRYQLGWLEEITDRLYENGIYIIMSTPSGARPKWLADKYPEVLRVDAARRRMLFGGRQNHCYTSPVYRKKVFEINSILGKKFRDHPGVILWHISNEYGGECHCSLCQKKFQEWVKEKYGTIQQVNQSWYTTFWSHQYQSFEQIESPSFIGESDVHGLTLAWKRFVTDQTADFAGQEIQALREAGVKVPVTTNLMYDYKGLNYDRLAQYMDVISWDSYPVWHKGEDIETAWDNGMQHDYMRSLKKKPFLLMESCPSGTNWQGVSKLKRPGLLNAAAVQTIAHGSDSVQYFQIRASRGGSEKFHGAVIDHSGRNDTRVFKEVKETGKMIESLAKIKGSQVKASAAVLYDTENSWALEDARGPRNDGLYYHDCVMKSYRALRRKGINVDVISEAQSLEGYQLVAVPMLYMFREEIQKKIREFVARGGCLVMTCWSGVVDQDDQCFLGETPYELTDVLGLRRLEIDSLYDGETNALIPVKGQEFSGKYPCRNLCEIIEPSTAETLMVYEREFYKDAPAVLRNRYGKGITYYIGADVDEKFYDDLYAALIRKQILSPVIQGDIPEGIEVSSRENGEETYIFVTNFKNHPVDISSMKLPEDILYGENTGFLNAYGSLIGRERKG